MSDNLADSTARLERLVAQIMKETDPVKYDEIGIRNLASSQRTRTPYETEVCASKAEW